MMLFKSRAAAAGAGMLHSELKRPTGSNCAGAWQTPWSLMRGALCCGSA